MQSDRAYNDDVLFYFDSKDPAFLRSNTAKVPSNEVVNIKLEFYSKAIPDIAYSCSCTE